MKRSSCRHGFTLVELMLVVSIIGLMAAAVAPAMGVAMADGRVASAAVDLVRLGTRARAESTSTGLAHLMIFSADSGTTLGRVGLYRGDMNLCNRVTSTVLIDQVAAIDYNVSASQRVDLAPVDQNNIQICYQPDGSMRTRNGDSGDFGFNAAQVEFEVTRTVHGVQQGVTRLVLLTAGGTARLVR